MICRPRLPGQGLFGDIVGRASQLRQILLHRQRHKTLCAELRLSRLTKFQASASSELKGFEEPERFIVRTMEDRNNAATRSGQVSQAM